MRHYDILFDRGAEKIHFTRSNCSEMYQGPYFTENVEFGMENKTKGNFNFFFFAFSPSLKIIQPRNHKLKIILNPHKHPVIFLGLFVIF